VEGEVGQAVPMRRRSVRVPVPGSAFAGFRFPPDVIMIAVRWYLRYSLSYRDVEELLAERGIAVEPYGMNDPTCGFALSGSRFCSFSA
jgi:hypothetical protein